MISVVRFEIHLKLTSAVDFSPNLSKVRQYGAEHFLPQYSPTIVNNLNSSFNSKDTVDLPEM